MSATVITTDPTWTARVCAASTADSTGESSRSSPTRQIARLRNTASLRRIARNHGAHPLKNVVTHPQRIRHDRECRVHRRTRGEEAAIDHVQVVKVMRFAVHVER